tara:strand:- start:191 stop:973 length:783 start_codon:yes stop_codon:yes gene_type:complete
VAGSSFGDNTSISGSLIVSGTIALGDGDDNVSLDGTTLAIDSSNNRVGIGTSSPVYKLHVNASAADTTSQITSYFRSADTDYSRIAVDSTSNADTQISFMNNGSTKWSIGNEAAADSFHVTTGFGPFDTDNPLVISSDGDTTLAGNTSLDGGYVLGNESLTASDTGGNASVTKTLSLLTNMGGNLALTLGNAANTGQVKKLLCTGYNGSNSLVVTVNSASWTGGSSGTITFSTAASFVHLVWANSVWWVLGASASGVSFG